MKLLKIMTTATLIACVSCGGSGGSSNNNNTDNTKAMASNTKIIFLHHSTGQVIWDAGVPDWFTSYNSANGKSYSISAQDFPDAPYAWDNYPYDYWNIWVDHAGSNDYEGNPTLETLTATYNVIVWKHCFPVSDIGPDGSSSVSSSDKTVANYKLQYEALKTKMHSFPNTRFIVWTGAARKAAETDADSAARARAFFTWVKTVWDEPGDNIFIWDFYELETEGTNYMLDAHAEAADSHPNSAFGSTVAPYLGQRIVDVIEGRGDSGSLTGH